MDTFILPSIPGEFHWTNKPLTWSLGAGESLTVVAGELTDLFVDPGGHPPKDNAPVALFTPPDDSFLFSARVKVDFASTFDAGVIQIRDGEDRWAKLCFEYSPQGQPTIVSVVTLGTSDDCNSAPVDGTEVYLRAAVTPPTIALHYSLDGHFWRLVRYFSLGSLDNLRAGLSAQAPTGSKCTAIFSEIQYRKGALNDIRSGE